MMLLWFSSLYYYLFSFSPSFLTSPFFIFYFHENLSFHFSFSPLSLPSFLSSLHLLLLQTIFSISCSPLHSPFLSSHFCSPLFSLISDLIPPTFALTVLSHIPPFHPCFSISLNCHLFSIFSFLPFPPTFSLHSLPFLICFFSLLQIFLLTSMKLSLRVTWNLLWELSSGYPTLAPAGTTTTISSFSLTLARRSWQWWMTLTLSLMGELA